MAVCATGVAWSLSLPTSGIRAAESWRYSEHEALRALSGLPQSLLSAVMGHPHVTSRHLIAQTQKQQAQHHAARLACSADPADDCNATQMDKEILLIYSKQHRMTLSEILDGL